MWATYLLIFKTNFEARFIKSLFSDERADTAPEATRLFLWSGYDLFFPQKTRGTIGVL